MSDQLDPELCQKDVGIGVESGVCHVRQVDGYTDP